MRLDRTPAEELSVQKKPYTFLHGVIRRHMRASYEGNHYVSMQYLSAAQLFYPEEQTDDPRSARAEEVLPLLSKAYGSPRNALVLRLEESV
jgi:hypothetical protein